MQIAGDMGASSEIEADRKADFSLKAKGIVSKKNVQPCSYRSSKHQKHTSPFKEGSEQDCYQLSKELLATNALLCPLKFEIIADRTMHKVCVTYSVQGINLSDVLVWHAESCRPGVHHQEETGHHTLLSDI